MKQVNQATETTDTPIDARLPVRGPREQTQPCNDTEVVRHGEADSEDLFIDWADCRAVLDRPRRFLAAADAGLWLQVLGEEGDWWRQPVYLEKFGDQPVWWADDGLEVEDRIAALVCRARILIRSEYPAWSRELRHARIRSGGSQRHHLHHTG